MSSVTALSAFGRLSVTMPAAPRRANRISEFSVVIPGWLEDRPEINKRRRAAERGATGVQGAPFLDQQASLAIRGIDRRRFEHLVDGKDHEHRIGPVGEDQYRPDHPLPLPGKPGRQEAEYGSG